MLSSGRIFCLIMLAAFVYGNLLNAEEGLLVLHVADTQAVQIPGVVLSTKGDGSVSPPTSRSGRTRIRLAAHTRPGMWVSLQIVKGNSGDMDWVFIDPWSGRVRVPPFENESDNFVPIVLARRTDRSILESSKGLEAIAANILEQLAPKPDAQDITEQQRRMVLEAQAAAFGLSPDEVDSALRAWSKKTQDPFEKALAALYNEKYHQAQEYLRESIESSKQNLAEKDFYLGSAYYGQGELDLAIESLKMAIRLEPSYVKAYSNLGVAYTKQGKLDLAITRFEQAIGIDPNDAIVHYNLGVAYMKQKQFAKASPTFKKAIRLDLSYVDAYYNLGLAYTQQNQLTLAVGALKMAIRLDPRYVDAHYNLGLAYALQKDLEAAIKSLKTAIELDPNYVDAHYKLGIIYATQEQLDLAIKSLKTAIGLEPNNIKAHYGLGLVYTKQERLDLAIASFKTAISLDRNYVKAHYKLGLVYVKQERLDLAIDSFKLVVSLVPENAEAHYKLACAYALQNENGLAIKSLQKAIALDRRAIESAKTNRNFDNIRQCPEFQKLIHSSK
jgi:tetratricopeptide (TPR) repeat protein